MRKIKKLVSILILVTFLWTSLFTNYHLVFAKNGDKITEKEGISQTVSNNNIQNLTQELNQSVSQNVYNNSSNSELNKVELTSKKEGERERKEIIVKYKDETKAENVKRGIKGKLSLKKLDPKKKINKSKTELLEIDDKDDIDSVVEQIKKDPNVLYAQRNYKLYSSMIPADQRFNEQWGLQNKGQVISGQAGLQGIDVDATGAWDITTGNPSIVIGVLDTGIDISHSDLKNNIYINSKEIPGNGIDDDGNGYIDDEAGFDFVNNDNTVYDGSNFDTHGTHVAGIIAASSNSEGISGIAPNVRVLPLKFIQGSYGYTSDAIEGIEYAKTMGIKIINCSWGGTEYNPALYEEMQNSGILFICAAGNSGKDIGVSPVYPACFDISNVISVAAVDNNGNLAPFSNYGTPVDISAPGVNILSTIPGNEYGMMSGTSMSAPYVSGAAALLISNNPNISFDDIKNKIVQTATKSTQLANKINNNGILDVYNALTGATATASPSPVDIEDQTETQSTTIKELPTSSGFAQRVKRDDNTQVSVYNSVYSSVYGSVYGSVNSVNIQSIPTLTILSKTSTSVTYSVTFPTSGIWGNVIALDDFNGAQAIYPTSPYDGNWYKQDGTYTITNLIPGGFYHLEMWWSTDGQWTGYTNAIYRKVWLPYTTNETLTRTDGTYVFTNIESNDKAYSSSSDFNRWLGHLDSMYTSLNTLVGAVPYNGGKIELKSTRLDINSENSDGGNVWTITSAWAGNPSLFWQPFMRDQMLRLSYDDWGEDELHELSHDFDKYAWTFDDEFFAFLKAYYVVESLGAKVYNFGENKYYTGSQYADFFKTDAYYSYDNTFSYGYYSARGLASIFIRIKNTIGWQPFKDTFRYFSSLSGNQIPSIPISKFNLFVSKLSQYSNYDVFSLITSSEKQVIESEFGGFVTATLTSPSNGASYTLGQAITISAIGTNCHHMAAFVKGPNDADYIWIETQNGNAFSYNYTPTVAGNYSILVKGRNGEDGAIGTILTTSNRVSLAVVTPKASSISSSSNPTSGSSYKIYANNVTNSNKVVFPTWTNTNGQDDLDWQWANSCVGTYDSANNRWEYTVNLSDHNNEDGEYITHVYGYDSLNNLVILGGISVIVDRKPPTAVSITSDSSQVNGTTFKIYANGVSDNLSGVQKVVFPTWTNANGQDDLDPEWRNNCLGTYDSANNRWEYTVNIANHNNEAGEYVTHVYAYDKAGNSVFIGYIVINVIGQPPKASSISSSLNPTNGSSYKVYANNVINSTKVVFPTWTSTNGQDDLDWQWANSCVGTYDSTNNRWEYTVNTSAHNNEQGQYLTDVYGYDSLNNLVFLGGITVVADKTPPTATSVTSSSSPVNGTTFKIYANGVSDSLSGVQKVVFPTWTSANGQDDIDWQWWDNCVGTYDSTNNRWEYTVNIANHNNEAGEYFTHVYAYDKAGNSVFLGAISVSVSQGSGNLDIDGDGIPDSMETAGIPIGYNGKYITTVYLNPNKKDTDGDGMNDGVELINLKYYNYDSSSSKYFYEAVDNPNSSKQGTLKNPEGFIPNYQTMLNTSGTTVNVYKSNITTVSTYWNNMAAYADTVLNHLTDYSGSDYEQFMSYLNNINKAMDTAFSVKDIYAVKILTSSTDSSDITWVSNNTNYLDTNSFSSFSVSESVYNSVYNSAIHTYSVGDMVFGTAVHMAVGEMFLTENPPPAGKSNERIPDTLLRPDLVYDDGNFAEIYEIKPISYSRYNSTFLYSLAQYQLSAYMGAYMAKVNEYTYEGTSWNPDGRIIGIPGYKKVIMLRTFDDQPGMIYYEIVDEGEPEESYECNPYTVTDEEGNTGTVFAVDPKTGYVLVAIGGAILIGTIVEDVFTAGLGTTNDPATIAAAVALIRKGITYAPAY